MFIRTVIVFFTFMPCIVCTTYPLTHKAPVFINGVELPLQVVTFDKNEAVPTTQICEDAKTKAGLNRLPPANVKCKMSSHQIKLEVLKFINVYEEKQLIRGKNGDEKVFELRVISVKWGPTKGGPTKAKGSQIWETLGLNYDDILHTHKDQNNGQMITFDSSEEFEWENLHILYYSFESLFLLDIGNGTTIDKDDNVILEHACIVDENLEEIVFKDIIEKKDYDAMSKRAILSPYNAETDNINEKILDMLDGEEKIYLSIDESDPEKGPTVQPEVLNSIKIPGFSIHELRLKNGAIVICLRNLNTLKKICNGTRMQILDMKEHVLRCLIISQNTEEQEEVFIPRITLIEDKKNFFGLRRHQFPIRLAFSMTINKAQGQTYEEIGLNLKDEVFNHGQLYVACSRVRSWNKIKVMLPDEKKDERKTLNIVYKEILQ